MKLRSRSRGPRCVSVGVFALAVVASACGLGGADTADPAPTERATSTIPPASPSPSSSVPVAPLNLYAATAANNLAASVIDIPPRVYVPHERGETVMVIDPSTYRVIDEYRVGKEPHHVVTGWDMQTLYALITQGDQLVPIDPRTGKPGTAIPVVDPYNLYFTPDGRNALVLAERFSRIDVYALPSWTPVRQIPVACDGVNHGDFSPDGNTFYASCESLQRKEPGAIVKVDLVRGEVIAKTILGGSAVDVRMAPDASVLFVANQGRNGVSIVDPASLQETKFVLTGTGAHGLYFSRDVAQLYVSNRRGNSVSVLNVASRNVVATWVIPGGGSPDMGSVSPDGSELWLTGRFDNDVYVFDTATGALKKRIRVGNGPHGLVYAPQPGRFSLGHTGNFR